MRAKIIKTNIIESVRNEVFPSKPVLSQNCDHFGLIDPIYWKLNMVLPSFVVEKKVPTEMHRIAPSCTELHRVAEPLFRISNLTSP